MSVDKDFDHVQVCSFLFDYVDRIVEPRVCFLFLFLDASPYFNTKFMERWAAETVERGSLRSDTLLCMVPGHTKFETDSHFSQISNLFYKIDVFETNELLHVIGACNSVPQLMAPRGLLR